MQRVVFNGDDLGDFPHDCASGYIKILFSPDGKALTEKTQVEALSPARPLMRTYSIRAFHPEQQAMTVDFVLHKDSDGPASKWAQSSKSGDSLVIGGPGPVKLVNNEADWFFIVGDMTALPALSCNLEQLPDSAKGYAFIEVMSELDIQDLKAPAGVSISWIINQGLKYPERLLKAVYEAQWLAGKPYIWCACEFNAMRALRMYFKNDRKIESQNMYISSYWKSGNTEDQHKVAKREDTRQA